MKLKMIIIHALALLSALPGPSASHRLSAVLPCQMASATALALTNAIDGSPEFDDDMSDADIDRYFFEDAQREYQGPYGAVRMTARRFIAEVSSAPKLRAMSEKLDRSEQKFSAVWEEPHNVVQAAAEREEWWTRGVRSLESDVHQNAEACQEMIIAAECQWAEQRARLIGTIRSAEKRIESQRDILGRAEEEVIAFRRRATMEAQSLVQE